MQVDTMESSKTANMTSPRTHIQRLRERGQGPTNQSAPRICHYLADLSLTPLLGTSSTDTTHNALTTLTTTALSAHTSASRLGLGAPLRLMIETKDKGPVVLHTFLDPHADKMESQEASLVDTSRYLDIGRLPDVHSPEPEPPTPEYPDLGRANGKGKGKEKENVNGMGELHLVPSGQTGETATTQEEKDASPPMLVGTVVIDSYNHLREARRTASKLEAMGKCVQEEWRRERGRDGKVQGAEDG